MSEQPEYEQDYYDDESAQQQDYPEQDYENEPPALARRPQPDGPGLLDSWFIRLLLAVILIAGVVAILIGGAYFQASSSRDEPLEIKAFPGLLQASYEKIDKGHDLQIWSGTVDLAELENHYKKQMDDCNRLFSKPEEGQEQSDQTIESKNYVRTTCLLDHSHELFGITQYVRLTVEPAFDEVGERTGVVNVTLERVWKE
ncbi:MAG: hypothetical protein HY862_05975 [Chloroflexi bacterium]|nr:hypothetical protein [Chloroflexota bacterium]